MQSQLIPPGHQFLTPKRQRARSHNDVSGSSCGRPCSPAPSALALAGDDGGGGGREAGDASLLDERLGTDLETQMISTIFETVAPTDLSEVLSGFRVVDERKPVFVADEAPRVTEDEARRLCARESDVHPTRYTNSE